MTASLSGTFSATGTSDVTGLYGRFSLSLTGGATATVQLQRSFDKGVTWGSVEEFVDTNAEKIGEEYAHAVLYRLECTAYTSGTVTYFLGQ